MNMDWSAVVRSLEDQAKGYQDGANRDSQLSGYGKRADQQQLVAILLRAIASAIKFGIR